MELDANIDCLKRDSSTQELQKHRVLLELTWLIFDWTVNEEKYARTSILG